MRSYILAAILALALSPAVAEAAPAAGISGKWTLKGYLPTSRPAAERIPRTVEGATPPLLPGPAALYRQRLADSDAGHPFAGTTARCLPGGMPLMMTAANYPIQILETPGQVTMLFEENHLHRIIHLGAKHPADADPTYLGHSIGHWEGDTLVVDTVGMRDETTLDFAGMPHSDSMHVVERIRRLDAKTLENLITVDDAKTFSRPWTMRMTYGAYEGELMEYFCAENQRNAPTEDNRLTFK